ncbi:GNAT family N-acetyltransferase [Larkinella knui]|uniref:N-acetyltransferase n=1 Tax=Larkinella knui TaxID=2025310 RepID=A0A3P1CZ28_9BACT|nr:GNAT family N-acetyltransferase [Larkinella knui]RRB18246.1 N-acetyltransferase [Larkinella knui]
MKTKEMAVSINRAENRFELEINGRLSFIAYTPKDDQTLVLTHTEVPTKQEGNGIGSRLVKGTFEYIEKYNLKMIPSCSFVANYIKSHPEYNRLVSPDYRKKY